MSTFEVLPNGKYMLNLLQRQFLAPKSKFNQIYLQGINQHNTETTYRFLKLGKARKLSSPNRLKAAPRGAFGSIW